MRKIISIRIIYEISGRTEAAYLSEFFKLCGVLVTEQDVMQRQVKYEILTQNFDQYDFNLFLGIRCTDYPDYFAVDCQAHSDKCDFFEYSQGFDNDLLNDNFEKLSTGLYNTISSVFDTRSQLLSELVNLYVNTGYCKKSLLKRFFSNGMSTEERESLYNEFLKIIGEIRRLDLKTDKEMEPYVLYAEALCCKKVNELCDAMQKNFYFPLGRMVTKCLRIVELAGEFPSAYMLAALFCSCDRALYGSVIPFFYEALEGGETKPYAAIIYYKHGQYLEKKKRAPGKANIVYKKSVNADSLYFRAVFKDAADCFERKKYLQAIASYKEIINILENKYRTAQLFPTEMEYLCKCYSMIGLTYEYYLDDTLKASKYYKSMIEILESDLRDNIYFMVFLDKEKQGEYEKILKRRISNRSKMIIDKYR